MDLSADLFLGDHRRSITLHDFSPGGYLDSAEGNYNPSSAAIRSTDGATIVNFTLDLHLVRKTYQHQTIFYLLIPRKNESSISF